VFDIATMGSSLTCGNAAGLSESWHRDLRNALLPGSSEEIRTYNFGAPGGNYLTGLSTVAAVIRLRPRVVIIEYSMNDCNLVYADAEAGTITILDQLKSGAPDSALFLMTMNNVFGSNLTTRNDLPDFYQMYRDLSVSESVGLIDSNPAWAGTTISDMLDEVHPTAQSNKTYLVPSIVAELEPLIS
jgi:lysophospholipase L1-like esterase